jgi:hypothetical protein
MEESREVNKVSEQKIEEFWRDATADDVARVMRGETVEARFKDDEHVGMAYGTLAGWSCDRPTWYCEQAGQRAYFENCQVYDPPAWFVNKPDPGEGYRLLEKFPPEPKLGTDEAWAYHAGCWQVVQNDNGVQEKTTWYRRRIETNNPTSSDSSRSRDNIPRGWRLLGKDEERLASDAYWSQACRDWIVIGDDRVAIANDLRRLHAIRQVGRLDLFEGFSYTLPSGQTIRITAKGFEVL